MFVSATPESVGISSKKVNKYLDVLESRGLYMHSVLLARGGKIFCEAYYEPFKKDECHRMYSVSKSYVGIAVCELEARGMISFDDKVVDLFPDKINGEIHPYLAAQTVRHMLMMQTGMYNPKNCWFTSGTKDRVAEYFTHRPARYPGTGYWYDSDGSFVLCALVERITGKTVLEFLREVCLDEIGFSNEARFLKAPGGHSWGDSGLICKTRDTALFARLLANGGKWGNKQLLSEKAIENATGNYTTPNTTGISAFNNQGYGYQIWRTYNGAIMFSGMHDEVMVYEKKSDILFVCTASNPRTASRELMISYLFSEIIDSAADFPLKENNKEYAKLLEKTKNCKLNTAKGEKYSEFEAQINGKRFVCEPNLMEITEFTLNFNESGGEFCYNNQNGHKKLVFGRRENVIQQFPETDYSGEIGGQKCEGNSYRCAVSAAWGQPNLLIINVPIIDEYCGILYINIGFNGGHAWLEMHKDAEHFLNNYNGNAAALEE